MLVRGDRVSPEKMLARLPTVLGEISFRVRLLALCDMEDLDERLLDASGKPVWVLETGLKSTTPSEV